MATFRSRRVELRTDCSPSATKFSTLAGDTASEGSTAKRRRSNAILRSRARDDILTLFLR